MKTVRCVLYICMVAGLISLSTAGLVAAQEQPTKPCLDEQADRAVKDLSQHMAAAKSLRAKIPMRLSVTAEGVSQEVLSSYTLAMQRPNKVALRLARGAAGMTVCSDGRRLSVYVPASNRCMVTDIDGKSADMPPLGAGSFAAATAMGAPSLPFINMLIRKDPYTAILEKVTKVAYVGVETVNGVECHRLHFQHPELDWDMWIQLGEKPWLMKCDVDLAKTMSAFRQSKPRESGSWKMIASITFTDWEADIELPEDAFAFEPPEGVDQDDVGRAPSGNPESLVGKQAPRTTLHILDGDAVRMRAKKSGHPVVLEFWATWCVPCRQSLKMVNDLAKTYQAKGVTVYLVNQNEDESAVRAFVKDLRLAWPAVLDQKGKLGKKYFVRGIPETVIIDSNGVVQAVHVGFAPDLEKVLREELDALLAGKNLRSAAEPAATSDQPRPRSEERTKEESGWRSGGADSGIH